jgi:hypothetical protein
MNYLLIINKFMAISMTIMLTLVILLSTSGSATGQGNKLAPGRRYMTVPIGYLNFQYSQLSTESNYGHSNTWRAGS